jgi:hypothetical protein
MFPPRPPFFFCVRSDACAADIATSVGEQARGNLPVSPIPFHAPAHAGASSPRFAWIPSSSSSKESENFCTPSRSSTSTTSS